MSDMNERPSESDALLQTAEDLACTLTKYAEYLKLANVGPNSWAQVTAEVWPHRPDTPLSIVTSSEVKGASVESGRK